MMQVSKSLKTTALAGLFGLGFLLAATGPALADRAFTRCDEDGDRCYRVVCDDDGDDCRRVSSYYNNSYYNNGYYNSYYNYGRDRDWNNRNYRRWVCDRDGDDCHWSYDRW